MPPISYLASLLKHARAHQHHHYTFSPTTHTRAHTGLLEGMSAIEADAYQLLAKLGASPVTRVLTAGGGAVNDKWTAMRAAALGVPVAPAAQGA